MGNCNFKTEYETDNVSAINKNHFMFHYVIGRGGFGKVWKVEKKKEKKLYAMKEMHKGRIISKRSVNSVMNEKKFLTQLNHPFLVNMHFAFQDRENLYLVIDIMPGGDLRYHFAKHRKFTEEQTKFFMACMILCLEYLHSKSILHRDIKPENLVFDEQGYMKITDLGIARVWNPDNAKDTSGTPGYMAPEVMCRQNHGVAVDYFAMGVIGYECMYGKRPYVGKTRKEIRDHILSKQVQIRKNEVPPGWSLEAADFVNKLIQRKPINRLGLNGPQEVKDHVWFKNYKWDDLLNKKIPSPFMPPNEDNFDAKYTNSDWKDNNEEQMRQNSMLLRRNSVQALFNGYYHDDNIAALNAKNPPNRMIEEHVPSSQNSQNTSMAPSVQPGGATTNNAEPTANSATNSNINTLQHSIHHNIALQNHISNGNVSSGSIKQHMQQQQIQQQPLNQFNSVNNSSKRDLESSGGHLRYSQKLNGHHFSNSMVISPSNQIQGNPVVLHQQQDFFKESSRFKGSVVQQQLSSSGAFHQHNFSAGAGVGQAHGPGQGQVAGVIPGSTATHSHSNSLQQHVKNHQQALSNNNFAPQSSVINQQSVQQLQPQPSPKNILYNTLQQDHQQQQKNISSATNKRHTIIRNQQESFSKF